MIAKKFSGLFCMILPVVASGTACAPADEVAASDDALAGASDLYGTSEHLPLQMAVPFGSLLQSYRAGQTDAEVTGTMTVAGKALDIKVAIRGNTSPKDCTFPKYKVELTRPAQAEGTPFQGHKKFRVNSHCGTGGPGDHAGRFNRVQNQISPIREDLAYRIVRAAGVPTYQTRLSQISYSDTSANGALAATTQYGMLIEAGGEAAKRFMNAGLVGAGSSYLNDSRGRPVQAGAMYSGMRSEQVARVFLAEALLANYDWIFKDNDLWNIDVFGVPNQAGQLPIPQDFDLSSIVQAIQDPDVQINAQMYKFRSTFGNMPSVVSAAASTFIARRAAVEAELALAERQGIAAGRLPTVNGVTTTDIGFLNARREIAVFYALPELKSTGAPPVTPPPVTPPPVTPPPVTPPPGGTQAVAGATCAPGCVYSSYCVDVNQSAERYYAADGSELICVTSGDCFSECTP
jgi:hypothetical protein